MVEPAPPPSSSSSSSSLTAAVITTAAGTKRPPPSSSLSDASSSSATSPPIPFLPPPVPPGWTRCHAYVERKHRFCRQQCQGKAAAAAAAVRDNNRNGSFGGRPRYCGNHEHLFYCNTTTTMESNTLSETPQADNSGNQNNNDNKMKQQQQQRIPCPMDPTHHIPADRLEKHILICPKMKHLRAMEKLYYFRNNLNTGGHGRRHTTMDSSSSPVSLQQESSSSSSSSSERVGAGRGARDIEWAKRVALSVLQVHEQVFTQQSPQNIPDDSSNVSNNNHDNHHHLYGMSHEDIVQALPLQDLSSLSHQQQPHDDEKSNLARAIQAYSIKSGGPKHVHQQASLLGHLRQLGAIPTDQQQQSQQQQQQQQQPEPQRRRRIINIMELGAGRGMMGLVAAGVVAAAATRTTPVNDIVASVDSTLSPPPTATTTRLILVERSGCRSKADRILRNHKNHAGPFNNTMAKKKQKQKKNTMTMTTTNTNAAATEKTTETSTCSTTTLSATPAASKSPTTPPSLIKDYMNLKDLEWSRIQCDLAHVDMKEVLKHSGGGDGGGDPSLAIPVPQQQQEEQQPLQVEPVEEELHVIAKHLCGVGTDLALKSLQPIRHSISTCLLATCCHGICSWKDYVGRDYLQKVMTGSSSINTSSTTNDKMRYLSQFGEAEFELLCQWSAGTVATNWSDSKTGGNGGGGDRKTKSSRPDQQKHGNDDDDDNEHRTAGSNNNNIKDASTMGVATIVEALDLKCGVQGLGRACQRLIDYGRLEYIRHNLFGDDSSSATTTTTKTVTTATTASLLSHEDKDHDVQLVYYVPPEITPQNAALMGRRRRR